MPLLKASEGRQVVPSTVNKIPLSIDETRLEPVVASSGKTVHYFQVCVLVEQRTEALVQAQVLETSCSEDFARMTVNLTLSLVGETAACVGQIKGLIPPPDEAGSTTLVYKEPIGPALVIPPWNAAFALAMRSSAHVIAAGCSVVMKCSEQSPLTHAMIVDIWHDAGTPPGVINSLQAARRDAAIVTEALIANEKIRKVEFIGSAAIGKIIAATASKHLKPIMMELGGKCPSIVLDDANLDKAAMLTAAGAVTHHGQACVSTERIIVQRSVAEVFIEKLVTSFKSLAPMAGQAASERVAANACDILKDARDKGAQFLVGNAEIKAPCVLTPSLVQVDPTTSKDQMRIVDEESFGPISSVFVIENDEEAIALANRSAYGLTAAIHTRNMERAIKMGRELEYGQVQVKQTTLYASNHAPFGGNKGSGWGRAGAIWGIENFLTDRTIAWFAPD